MHGSRDAPVGRRDESKPTLPPPQVAWRLMWVQPRLYFGIGVVWILFFTSPVLAGLLLNAIFDQLSRDPVDTARVLGLCATLAVVEGLRGALVWLMLGPWSRWWQSVGALLRTNVLRSLVGLPTAHDRPAPAPSADRLPGAPGEAVSRCRDDVDDLARMTDNYVDVGGALVFAVVAVGLVLGVEPWLAAALTVPVVVALLAARRIVRTLERWHREARRQGAQVTAFIGDVFANVLAVKSSGAEDRIVRRLEDLNRRRRRAAVRDRLGQDLLSTVTGSTGEISVGLVLLLAVPALRRGDLTVGELALFTSYAGWLTLMPQVMAQLMYRHRQGKVATQRLGRLMADHESTHDLLRHRPLWVSAAGEYAAGGEGLEELEISGLTARYPTSGRGVVDVDLLVRRGEVVVVTGAVGSGKTTLLRALLGLMPTEAGGIRWNGRPVDLPHEHMRPPRVAYCGQVPRLFSGSLAENLQLGWESADGGLDLAVRQSVFDRDVADMPDGLHTVVGSRGMRLSGGQIQRATAARALVRRPDLLVVDDLSSALDVETENLLWQRLTTPNGEGPATLLVVSHRRVALQQAHKILVLEDGRAVAHGGLDELLETSAEMRRLWTGKLETVN